VIARRWLAAALVALACATASAQAAEPWPARPVRIVVTYPPGGTSDLIARISAQILTEKLGKPFVVENRAGAGGNIGTDAVAKSPPDGYTLLQGTFGPITTAVALYPKLPYAPARDLIPIVIVADVPNLLLVHPSVPARTVTELVDLAKARPGKLNMAVSSLGGTPHLLTEMFQQKAGIRFTSIPYKGTAPALTDVVAGQVEVDFDALPAVLPFVKADRLRPLAIAGRSRVAQLPDVPTMAEAGYPDVEISAWHGLLAPAGTPPEVIALVNRTLVSELRTPATRARLRELGAEVVASTPEEMDAFLRAETTRWTELIGRVKITVDQ
jgi:tripartite-type tricarboxylate transporter receptor subunit TctC